MIHPKVELNMNGFGRSYEKNSHFCDEFDTNSEMETWKKAVNVDDDKDDDYCRSVAVSMASISEPKVHMYNIFSVRIDCHNRNGYRQKIAVKRTRMEDRRKKIYSLCYQFPLIQFGLGLVAEFILFFFN